MDKKILIVDDQPENLQTIVEIFSNECSEWNVIKAPNGKIALKIVQKIIPDMIITDWEMPQLDGIELIKKLKNNPQTTDIPVIMCTGVMTSSQNLNMALEAGAIDYIRKPVDAIELIARTKANLHLAEQYRKVKKLNDAKDQIFSVISHDLRGPVGNIKTLTDFVIQNPSGFAHEEIIDFFKLISRQSASTFNILENLLMWARSQQNKVSVKPKVQSINNAVNSSILLLEAMAKKKNIAIRNTIAPNLNAYYDLNLISTVIRNLISNAIKFTQQGGEIILSAEADEKFHIISVTDNGVGISQRRVDKIFDKTAYETTFGTNDEKGSGLGLKLCLDFVERNNGKIWVESKEGKGSSFRLTLPVH